MYLNPQQFCINLQFATHKENKVVQEFSARKEAQHLGNSILSLFNRAPDVFCVKPCLKLLQDIFSYQSTADFFFVNDLRVLKDIIIRQLSNLDKWDEVGKNVTAASHCCCKLLPSYLQLLHLILKNHPNVDELPYRKEEISQIVAAFLSLEVYPSSHVNYQIAEKIFCAF